MPGALCALFVTSFLLIPVLANPDTSSGDWLRYIKLRFTCPPLSATCTALVLISLSHIAVSSRRPPLVSDIISNHNM